MYIVLFPPNTAPDEHSHIATAYYDANKILFRNSVDEEGYVWCERLMHRFRIKWQISLADASYYYNQLLRKGGQEPAALNSRTIGCTICCASAAGCRNCNQLAFPCKWYDYIVSGKNHSIVVLSAMCFLGSSFYAMGKDGNGGDCTLSDESGDCIVVFL